jgi:hypothetical protein
MVQPALRKVNSDKRVLEAVSRRRGWPAWRRAA